MKRVLIIRCGALGDLVYATSVIDALQLEYGEKTLIDFVCTPGSASLFKSDTRVNHVFILKHKKIPILLSSQKKAIIRTSKKEPYDILINFEFGKQFKKLVFAIEAKKKIGSFFDLKEIPSDIVHMVEITKFFYQKLVSAEVFTKSFPRVIGSNPQQMKVKYKLPNKYIIISPSNSHQKRNILNYRAWENDSWIELIQKLCTSIQVVIIGNKNEDDFFEKLKPYPHNVIDLVSKTSLSDLIGVIEGATALIATDTGTAHLASAVNTEVFALIGPTPAEQTGPYKSPFNKVHIITSNQECAPCYKTQVMKACENNICMKEISVTMVFNSIKSANLF